VQSTLAPLREPALAIGRWRVDPRADEITSDGQVVKLEPLKMRLLLALAERPGEVVLTQELLDTVWSGVIVTSASVYQGIAQLRRLLDEDAGTPYIETIPRKGYRLVAPVRQLERPAAPEAPAHAAETPVSAAVPAAEPSRPGRRHLFAAAGVFAAAAAAGVWRWQANRAPAVPLRVAVLPFVDRTRGAAESALSEGLAFDIIRALGRYPALEVVAAESAQRAGAVTTRIAEVAQRLAAAFVLVGQLTRAGSRLQLSVSLLEQPGGRVRWAREFEQAIATLAQLPQQIADEAAAALHVPALPGSRPPAAASDAYEFWVLGQHAWRQKTKEAFAKARDYFERGIQVDAAFARNYVGLGWTWLGLATNGDGIDLAEAMARAAPLFDKALQLEPELPEALVAQGVLAADARRFEEARSRFEHALRLNPNDAQAHHSYGVAEFDDGWPQRAAPHFERAAALNPLSLSPWDRLGLCHAWAGRWEAAERAYRRAVELEPKHPNGHWGLGILAYARGDLAGAVARYRDALARDARRPFLWDELGWLYLHLGLPERAAEAFAQVTAQLPRSRWPAVHAAYAWAARPDATPPAALGADGERAPDGLAIEVALLRAMAGLPLAADKLQQALALDRSRESDPASEPTAAWFVFLGRSRELDLAAVYGALGRRERAEPLLSVARAQLERLARQGNAWHALAFHETRLHALAGDRERALERLAAAFKAGSRRAWQLRSDPAFATLRADERFKALLAETEADTARQRAALPA
jgi:DNA-binding winged helix-turn-helix (wHTH) protein/tetratricopeptide (TPR) repeat protein